jgi:hypothetical protein
VREIQRDGEMEGYKSGRRREGGGEIKKGNSFYCLRASRLVHIKFEQEKKERKNRKCGNFLKRKSSLNMVFATILKSYRPKRFGQCSKEMKAYQFDSLSVDLKQ